MSDVMIFAPSPTLTVTIEAREDGSEIHVHTGGQGVWQARMLLRLGMSVTMSCALTGELGGVLRHLLEDEGITVVAVERPGRGSAYVHDRRDGQRDVVAETAGDILTRHELDELYGLTLREGLRADTTILSGPAADVLPAEVYRRLASDLGAMGRRVVADLAGDRMIAAVEGGVNVLKVSDEELVSDGWAAQARPDALHLAMHALRRRGAGAVIVTRSTEPFLLLDDSGSWEVSTPRLDVADTHGAGDSFTAAVAAALSRGADLRDAVVTGAAAGALNVTRHGLGTGDEDTIAQLRHEVTVRPLADVPIEQHLDRDGLAHLAAGDDGRPAR